MHPGAVRQHAHVGFPADVAGVDAQLADAVFRGHDGQGMVKVNIRHQGAGRAVHQVAHGLGTGHVVHAHPHQVAARGVQGTDLGQGLFHIPGVGVGHGLHPYRVVATHDQPAHGYLARFVHPVSLRLCE